MTKQIFFARHGKHLVQSTARGEKNAFRLIFHVYADLGFDQVSKLAEVEMPGQPRMTLQAVERLSTIVCEYFSQRGKFPDLTALEATITEEERGATDLAA